MSDQTATIASLCVSTLQSLIVFAANFFTIAVFWIHRNKLRRTYLLLINLAVADLLVGFAYMTPYLKALALPSYFKPFTVLPKYATKNNVPRFFGPLV